MFIQLLITITTDIEPLWFFPLMCDLISTHQPANPEETYSLFIEPYPRDVAMMVHSSGLKQQCPRGNEHMDQ